jgi:exoribonuclease II
MILANVCAAKVLQEKLGFGIYNLHTGFDQANAGSVLISAKLWKRRMRLSRYWVGCASS